MVVVMVVLVFLLVLMVVMMMAAIIVLILVLQTLHFQLGQLRGQGSLALHGLYQLLTGELIPGCSDNGGHLIVLPQHADGIVQLELGDGIGTGQDDGGSGFNLIVVELAEILHIHLDLAGIYHGHGVTQGHLVAGDLVYGPNHIGKLAHAGGFNDHPVRGIVSDHLFQRPAEVAHQGAADAAGVHFGDVDARILQESAVNADFAEFVLNQHQLLALIALGNHLFDQRGLARTQEAGINIYFGHKKCPFSKNSLPNIITLSVNPYKEFSRNKFYRSVNFKSVQAGKTIFCALF